MSYFLAVDTGGSFTDAAPRAARRRARPGGRQPEPVPADRPASADRLSGSLLCQRGPDAGSGGAAAIPGAHRGHVLGAPGEAALRVVRREEPPRAAGPRLPLRWAGQSPNFHLSTWACPSCVRLLRVEERRCGGATGGPAARRAVPGQ